MKNTIKIFTALVITALAVFITFNTMPTVDTSSMVHDLDGQLPLEKIDKLEVRAAHLSDKYGVPVIVVVAGDSRGRDTKQFVDDFYIENNFVTVENQEGVVFLVDMDSRNIDMRVYGTISDYLTQGELDDNLDASAAVMRDSGSIYNTAQEFLTQTDIMLEPWKIAVEEGYTGYTDNGGISVLTCFLIGFGLSALLMVMLCIAHRRSLPNSVSAGRYVDRNRLQYNVVQDKFIRMQTTQTRVASSDSSSSGGSGSSGSSGGFSSSGGSRSF